MKKILVSLLVGMMVFAFAACSDSESESESSTDTGLISGTFSKENAISFDVHELTCFAPNGWDYDYYDDDASEECVVAHYTPENEENYVASYSVDYWGQYDDFNEGKQVVCDEFCYEPDSLSEISIDGCDEAYEYNYTGGIENNPMPAYVVIVDWKGSTYSFLGLAEEEYYDEDTFKDMILAINFTTAEPATVDAPSGDIVDIMQAEFDGLFTDEMMLEKETSFDEYEVYSVVFNGEKSGVFFSPDGLGDNEDYTVFGYMSTDETFKSALLYTCACLVKGVTSIDSYSEAGELYSDLLHQAAANDPGTAVSETVDGVKFMLGYSEDAQIIFSAFHD